MGRLLGSLKDFSGADLGGVAIKAALERAGVAPRPGRLRDHGPGAAGRRRPDPRPPGRGQGAASRWTCPALTINKVCLSGLDAIALADQLIRAGEFDIVVAGGMESMTNAPHLLPKSRDGLQVRRRRRCVDSMAYDGLSDAFDHVADGRARPRRTTRELGITREEQDAFAARSHQRAAAAAEERPLRRRDRPGRDPAAQGRPDRRSREDEGIRADTTAESLARLRPAFAKDGTITAGSRVADLRRRRRGRRDEQGQGRGARADLARRDRRARHRRRPGLTAAVAAGQRDRARRCAQGGPRPRRTSTWSRSTRRSPRSASQSTQRPRRRPTDKVNVNGGAIALGHPIGMSGARLVLHLALELQRRGGGLGAAALCGGGGQGDALIAARPGA